MKPPNPAAGLRYVLLDQPYLTPYARLMVKIRLQEVEVWTGLYAAWRPRSGVWRVSYRGKRRSLAELSAETFAELLESIDRGVGAFAVAADVAAELAAEMFGDNHRRGFHKTSNLFFAVQYPQGPPSREYLFLALEKEVELALTVTREGVEYEPLIVMWLTLSSKVPTEEAELIVEYLRGLEEVFGRRITERVEWGKTRHVFLHHDRRFFPSAPRRHEDDEE